jgi:hypothetical protein
VKSHSVAVLQLGDLILTAPSGLREQVATRKTLKGNAALCRRLRPDTSHLSEPVNAARLALRGASPIPIASGKRGRYRLNPGGDRQANRALGMWLSSIG